MWTFVDGFEEMRKEKKLLLGLSELETILEEQFIPAEDVLKELRAIQRGKSDYQGLIFFKEGRFYVKARGLELYPPFKEIGFRRDQQGKLRIRYFTENATTFAHEATININWMWSWIMNCPERDSTSKKDNCLYLRAGFRKDLVIYPDYNYPAMMKALEEAAQKIPEEQWKKEYHKLDQFQQMEKLGLLTIYSPPSATAYKIGPK